MISSLNTDDFPLKSDSFLSENDDFALQHDDLYINTGHHGEVWRAVRAPGHGDNDAGTDEPERFVLKRIFVEKGVDIRLAGSGLHYN